MNKKTGIILFLVLASVSNMYAQSKKFSVNLNAGPGVKLLESGVGFHVGVQPYYAVWKYAGIEALASYSNIKINGSFISGRKGKETNVNLLLGGRVYFVSPEKKNRVFVNILFGQRYTTKTLDGNKTGPAWESAGSAGLYFQPSRFLIGAGVESPGYVFLRFGLTI